MIVVEVLETSKDKENLAKIEIFKNDIETETLFSIPGFDSIPEKNKKMLMQELAGGNKAVFLTPMETDIEPGERKIFATNNGTITGSIYLKNNGDIVLNNDNLNISFFNNGKIEINGTTAEMLNVISNFMQATIDLAGAVATGTTATALGPQPLSTAGNAATAKITMTSKKVEFDSFKN